MVERIARRKKSRGRVAPTEDRADLQEIFLRSVRKEVAQSISTQLDLVIPDEILRVVFC